MINSSLHCTENGVDDITLWSYAVKHSGWVLNRVPNQESWISLMEILTKTKSNHFYLRRSLVLGCPVFVLEAKLQNDQKLPKWNYWSHKGQYLGFSDEHSTLVATVRNLKTGYISPQYHIMFDDLFETKYCRGQNEPVIDQLCNNIFDSSRDWYAGEEYATESQLIYRPPPLADVWIDEPGRRERKEHLGKQRQCQERRIRPKNSSVPVLEQEIIPHKTKDDPPPFGALPLE